MPLLDPRVDAYIERAAPFAQPILTHLRAIVHAACPEVVETMKWSMPHFEYHGVLCNMAAFKQHVAFGFWKGKLVVPDSDEGAAMGDFGRITRLRELPGKKVLSGYIKRAMQLNVEGVKTPRTKTATPKPKVIVPEDFNTALQRNRKAAAAFEALSPGHRREYVEWITEARRAETRSRRLHQAIEWLSEGRTRNWKYQNC